MKVRKATANDAELCAQISPIRSAAELKKLLKQSDTQWLVMEDGSGKVVGIGILNLWTWNKMAWIWDLTIDVNQRGKGYGRALLKEMLQAARKSGARVVMDFGPPNPHDCPLAELLVYNGFRVCGMNDRWFAHKYPTAVFYGYDL